MKKIFFTTALLLAVASLGLALPQGKTPKGLTPTPSAHTTPASTTPAPTTPAPTTPSLDGIDSLKKALGGDISPACSAAILTIFTSPEAAKCAPLPVFLPLLPVILDPGFLKKLQSDPAGTFKSVEPALIKFATGFCAVPKCSDAGVAGAIKTLSDSCKDDLKNNQIVQLLFGVIVFYSPIHDNICFTNAKTKEFCWDESLKTIFSLPKSPIKIIDGGLIDSVAVADPFAICTTCNKDIVNTFGNFLKNNELALKVLATFGITETQLTLIQTGVAVKCGIKFEDGKIPDKPPS